MRWVGDDLLNVNPSNPFKTEDRGQKTEYIHTLNGSGVAFARLIIALIENYQQKDGSVIIPKPLRKYMDGQKKFRV